MKINYTPGPLLDASRTTPTALWNDSADLDELRQSIAFGGVVEVARWSGVGGGR